jgi:hypothetical protein
MKAYLKMIGRKFFWEDEYENELGDLYDTEDEAWGNAPKGYILITIQ